jgi:ferritin
MIEVFKTNVRNRSHAKMLVSQIHTAFGNYEANFDLDDCDNILRIKSTSGTVQASRLIAFLKDFGFNAEVLEDKCFTR